ncbi:hypothetical protein AMELA_G00259090 [Ameiurus melas]|uniref:Myelin proteolipid protein n=1 Tax=Ameiurus melas TaxID=219545 RepID=A0A7J5ZW48_AMEME|nr:hypothetical protein AMELA_G00259090 [Ameiurus melas]
MGCYDSCVRCLGAVPYVTLSATLLCYAGVALFCAGAHEALTHTHTFVHTHFARAQQDFEVLADFIKYFHKPSENSGVQFNRCLSLTFLIVTCALAVIWLVVFAFSVIPVYFLFNMAETCHTVHILSETTTSLNQHAWVCVDARQYGLLPWKATPGKVCGMTMANICKEPEFYMTYDLYITALAGAGATLLGLILYIIAATYNYAVLRFLGSKGIRC